MACASPVFQLETENYLIQKKKWPHSGNYILAQYDEDSVIVYQAFTPSIADYAVKYQRFGGPDFSFERMSWIKTNFLWMMFRCGWASKKNQERVLAIQITRDGFEEILANTTRAKQHKKETSNKSLPQPDCDVRLQWDPDHAPTYEKLSRRAIQLGLKGTILSKYGTQWILSIQDITAFVHEQKKILDEKGSEHILVAKETVYPVRNPNIAARIAVDFHEEAKVSLVKRLPDVIRKNIITMVATWHPLTAVVADGSKK